MNAVRTVLLVLVCAAAIAGTMIFFGSDEAPVEERDRVLAGTWRGPAPDGEVALELALDGRYALVSGSAGSAAVECGKWRYRDGSLQMRSKKRASIANTLLLRQPGLRAGGATHHPPPDESLTLTLLAAQPGGKEAAHWELRRAADSVLPLCD